jgi:hypothetical protein
MPNLVNCVSCGKSVSRSAGRCPHCGTDDPVGVLCFKCGGRLAKGKADCFGQYPVYLHHECMIALSREFFSPQSSLYCRDCGSQLTNTAPIGDVAWVFGYPEKPCPKCGCMNPIKTKTWPKSQCSFCLKKIYHFQPSRSKKADGINNSYYHVPCFKAAGYSSWRDLFG